MTTLRKFGFLAVLLLPAVVFCQNLDEAAVKQQRRTALIEQTLNDVQNLKLGENRAITYSKIGNLIWDSDQKRARTLFQTAIGELMAAQAVVEANPKSAYQNDLLTGSSTRPMILNAIAARDAEFALDALVRTRPAAITKALSADVKSSKINNSSNLRYLAQNEINLEQNFMRLAAEQNPDRAAAILRDSLSKAISNETVPLLKKLADKDPKEAADLAAKIVGKLIESKLSIDGQADYQVQQAATGILNEYISTASASPRPLCFDDGQMHQLTDKLIAYFLGDGSREAAYLSYSLIPIAEKLSPRDVDRIKQAARVSPRGEWGGISYDPDLQKLLSEDNPQKLITAAKNYPQNSQRQIYQTAANKLASQGNIGEAAELLKENFSDDALDEALGSLNWQYSSTLINSNKFAEAEQMIDQLPETNRVNALVNLANSIYQKNPDENKAHALSVLGKARSLTSDDPETTTEMNNLMQITSSYANMQPAEAFRIYEGLIPKMNDLSDAAALINGFQGGANIRQGEYVMNQGNYFGFYGGDYSMLQTLSKTDFDRTIKLIDSFSRKEVRITLKLQMIEGLN